MKRVVIGSRGSQLALWQAEFIKEKLSSIGLAAEIKIIKTQGDKIQNLSFDKIEGKGFFTKELEEALLAREIDLAVHSHKDLPTENPEGLTVAAVSYREDPSELLIIHPDAVDQKQYLQLKKNAVVGTSSARRKSQLLSFRTDVTTSDVRGNVPTRIEKVRKGEVDAILLAAAGIERLKLDLSDLHVEKLDHKTFIPAPAQGVLAIQTREDDDELIERLQKLNEIEVQECIRIERKILNLFDGGCQLPLGAYCEKAEEDDDAFFRVWVSKASSWDSFPLSLYVESKRDDIAEMIVEKIRSIKPASVFLTRGVSPTSFTGRALQAHGFTFSGSSLIEMKTVPFRSVPQSEWIFFSSKHAVSFFFDQKPDVKDVKFGVVGKATAEALRKYGKKPDFVGYSTDTRLTGKQFAATAGNATVLFPMAKGSMRTIQQQFSKKENVKDLVVYETIKHETTGIQKADIYVFTSPSNVEAFFEKNKLQPDVKVVAMGEATAAALAREGVKKVKLPSGFDEASIVQAIFSIA